MAGASFKKPSVAPAKGKATGYTDFFQGKTKPNLQKAAGYGNGGATKPTASPVNDNPDVDPKAEALRRRLKKTAQRTRAAGKVNSKLKSRR